ncbi:MAG: sugar phosphate nucleotidyltransferase [Acetobacteraceae bacterium]|jgi:D-glycero-alpha-D-manno-heptose 1-phosphate guanylyltransferase|nr:sugar phosphate nucleotidyltransferase [Acetobacteraceae bacterium]
MTGLPGEVVVLVGGLGTRLRPVVADVPKPLAPVAGRPFLYWLLDGFARQGLRRAVLAVGYRAEAIRDTLGTRFAGLDLAYAEEESPRGTGGAVWAALPLCTGPRVFVANGDSWIGVGLRDLACAAPEADLVLAVRPVPDRSRYGAVVVDGDRVVGLTEKGEGGEGLVNAGLYLMRRDLPERRPMPASFSLEHEVLARPAGLDIRAVATDAPFLDIGTPEDYAAAQALIPRWAEEGGA